MKQKVKDRLIEWTIILLFVSCVGVSVYYIVKMMTHWKVKGLG